MPNIRDLPTELLMWIVSYLNGSAIFSLARSCTILYSRLQPSIWKYNVKFQNSNLLHLAAKTGNVRFAEALLRHNANINAFYRGKTPLMRALQYPSTAVRELLLSHRELDINLQNQARDSALWYAIHYGNSSIVKSMLDHPASRANIKHKHGRTALHLAVFAGRIGFACHFNRPVMKAMFQHEVDSAVFLGTQLSRDAELPLHQAVSYGSIDAVKRLIKRKRAKLHIQDHNGDTPLHLAVQSRSLEMVDLLLSHPGADVNCKDKAGNTLLWLSTHSSCNQITERLLAEKDVDINFIGGHRNCLRSSTSLHHAVTGVDTVALQLLLATPGIDVNICVAGQSPLYTAAGHGRVNVVAMLLKVEGVEINGRGLSDPPLCRAVERGHLDVVRLLVQQGTCLDINESASTSHDTALCIAARGGNLEMVQALLRHDQIDVNIRNRWFEDPLMLAVKGGHTLVVNALVDDHRMKRFTLNRSLDLARGSRKRTKPLILSTEQ
ncbi:Cyclin-like F-box [Penicillium camemberti]|uniref:Cyclin-like F-box n=1 Tax=Penicillium camemberti (strain FM 013) TaxID=1429867 RepID=A0A0G4PYU5_PENC3|nr:Cyclin-like F-box [Penicillium camemberti]